MAYVAAAVLGGAALNAASSMYQNRKNRKEQKKADKENRRQQAFNNLINLMIGNGVQSTPVTPVQGSMGSDALSGLSGIAQAYAQGQMYNNQLAIQREQNAYQGMNATANLINAQRPYSDGPDIWSNDPSLSLKQR